MGYNKNKFMEKVILHCDLNNFYASVEQKNHPEYVGMPLAVSGNPENRHGIVLAKNYLANLKRAADEGAEIIGYQHWSLMDNFEWAEGYEPRFGLIHVDFESGKRTLKDSAYWYKHVIETNGEEI